MSETITERAFIHDIANAVTIAHGMLHILELKTKSGGLTPDESLVKIQKALHALDRAHKLINDRRAQIRLEGGYDVGSTGQS